MKLTPVLFAAAVALAPLAHAQSGAMKGMDMKGHGAAHAEAAQPHRAQGVVKSVNAGKGTVTIAHGPVASLNWPGMTMAFRAKDKSVLSALKPGQKIEFEFVQEGKAYIVTRVK